MATGEERRPSGAAPQGRHGGSSRTRWAIAVGIGCLLGIAVAFGVLATSTAPSPSEGACLPCGGPLFSWGAPFNYTDASGGGCVATVGHYCYSIEIAGDSMSSPSEMNLSLRSPIGAILPWPVYPAPDTVWLFSPLVGSPVAEFSTITFSWTSLGGFQGTVSGGFTLVIFTGGIGASYGLHGDEIVLTGVNGFHGTVPSNSFP